MPPLSRGRWSLVLSWCCGRALTCALLPDMHWECNSGAFLKAALLAQDEAGAILLFGHIPMVL
jgi:hypothetical protein